jgi:hypothetical protein
MSKISHIVCLIVLLVFVATSCMARALEGEVAVEQAAERNNFLHHLIMKRMIW